MSYPEQFEYSMTAFERQHGGMKFYTDNLIIFETGLRK